ncbi:MAG TPA: PHB depolymerase family esterase [Kofleriaceae bacterium]|nr:PHB depolymerase family esterase [Kofleriaceae bacterium]
MRGLALVMLLAACGSSDDAPPTKTYGGDRPVDLRTPATLTEGKKYPLVVILHGFGANGFAQYAFFNASALVNSDRALVLAPDGTVNSSGQQFWNADPACCDFEGKNPDDVAYIGGLIDDVVADWPIDKNQIYLIGHSNGGYMSYRMACERADVIAAVASLAGNAATNASACTPDKPVNVLHMHGTADATVPFASGGTGAVASVSQWATHDGCGTTRTSTVTLDLDSQVAGAETHGETTSGCPSGVAVDLWTMEGSSHIPLFNANAIDDIFSWLTAHKRG